MTIPPEIVDRLSQLNCEEVAARLGINVDRHKARCFMHDDHSPSLSFFAKDRKAWNCFVCRKGGNAIHLVMNYCGLDFVETCKWLGDQFNIRWMDQDHTNWDATYRRIQGQIRRNRPSTGHSLEVAADSKCTDKRQFNKAIVSFLLDSCSLTPEASRFLYQERSLSKHVIEQIGIVGLSESWQAIDLLSSRFSKNELTESGVVKETNGNLYLRFWLPCIIFPYKDKDGELIGIQTRYIGSNKNAPRFQFISGCKTSVFNLQILENLKPKDELYLSEGITDCLALLSSGKKAVAVPSASILPDWDLWCLRHFDLHMYPDNDKAGSKAYEALLSKMIDFGSYVWKERLPTEYKDFSEYYKSTSRNG